MTMNELSARDLFRKIAAPGLTISETLDALSELAELPERGQIEQWKVDAATHAASALRDIWFEVKEPR